MAKSLWKYAPLLIILLSGGIGLSVSYLYNAGAYVNWQPLGSPTVASDEKWGIAYLEPNDASVIVSDGVGTMERGSLTLCAQGESCWQPIEATAFTDNLLLDDIRQGGGCNTNAAIAWMRPFPGDTLGCIQYDDMQAGTHFIRIAKAAIDVDGQIWLWQFIPGSGALLIIVRSVVAGFLLALAVWLVRSLMKQ